MKVLFLADLHLHATPVWRLDWLEKFVNKLLQEQSTLYRDHDLYLMGDVTEARDHVDSRVLNLLIILISQWKQGEVIWVCGQHDSYLPGRATLEALQHTGVCKVVDRELFHHKKNDIWFVPFARQTSWYREMLAKVPDNVIVCTHMPTIEIIEMYGGKVADGISVKEFDRFQHTYSGDIHVYKDFDKFSYIGAPSQRDWRDKGVVGQIATLVDGIFKRIPTVHPVHLEVEDESEIPTDIDCILRVKRGVVSADKHNVLAATTTVELKPESVQFTAKSESSVIADYVRKNPLDGFKADIVCEAAQNTLKEAEINAG